MGKACPELVRTLAMAAEERTGIRFEAVMARGRRANVAMVRQLIMFILRESTGATWDAIGELMNRDHGTAIFAHRKVSAMLEVEREGDTTPTADLVAAMATAADIVVPTAAKPRL